MAGSVIQRFATYAGMFLAFCYSSASLAAWQPTKTVEFIVPAGTGGGADQMAR